MERAAAEYESDIMIGDSGMTDKISCPGTASLDSLAMKNGDSQVVREEFSTIKFSIIFLRIITQRALPFWHCLKKEWTYKQYFCHEL